MAQGPFLIARRPRLMFPPPPFGLALRLTAALGGLSDLPPLIAAGLWSTGFAAPFRWRLPGLYLAALLMGGLWNAPNPAILGPDAGAALATLILGSATCLGLAAPSWAAYATVAVLGGLHGLCMARDLAADLPHILAAGGLGLGMARPRIRGGLARGLGGLIALAGLAAFIAATRR
jgi:hypothetical protein